MAVLCPGCGRGYDVSLFQFGRTIRCTCGERVGRDVQERPIALEPEPRFLCDAMLGGLARWLRALGYDAAYDPAIEDDELIRRAVEEERVVLTRDRRLTREWRVAGLHLLDAEEPLGRLREVARRFDLEWPRRLFRRCLECNDPLTDAEPDEVRRRVPERPRRRHDRFRRCPSCDRIYWEGSHARRMRRRLEELFGGRSGGGSAAGPPD